MDFIQKLMNFSLSISYIKKKVKASGLRFHLAVALEIASRKLVLLISAPPGVVNCVNVAGMNKHAIAIL